jgi:RHS repeat-associated protein
MENNGQFQLRYDERNRLDRVIVGGLTTTYGVNGLGERTTKDGRPTFGVFERVYDLSGQLLGLYKSGALDEEIVWLGALPVGTIQGGAAYSIAPDHLGAPYKIVNSANAQVWVWDHDPFGNGAPTAAAGFWHRLRFPGQVYDSESKLHSNGHRDYDPRLGRYVESDPTGLEGGINTYVYAGNDPVNAIDPLGLDPRSDLDDEDNAIEPGARFYLFGASSRGIGHNGGPPLESPLWALLRRSPIALLAPLLMSGPVDDSIIGQIGIGDLSAFRTELGLNKGEGTCR